MPSAARRPDSRQRDLLATLPPHEGRRSTITEIAEALGITKSGAEKRANRENWFYRTVGVVGGRQRLYPFASLPQLVRDALDRASAERVRAELASWGVEIEPRHVAQPMVQPSEGVRATTPAAVKRRDAKLCIFESYETFKVDAGYSDRRALEAFATLYTLAVAAARAGAAASLPKAFSNLDRTVFETVPKLSSATLRRIVETMRAGKFQRLAGAYGSRDGSSPLECGEIGRDRIPVEDAILALVSRAPHIAAPELRRQLIGQFGGEILIPSTGEFVPVPPLRTVQRHLARIKAEKESVLLSLVDPDRWRSEKQFAFGTAYAGLGMNDLWMIDASPADVLLVDGRHAIYVLIDVWSRRILVMVTKTPRAEAVVALLRRGILEWGVPKEVKTDNGSDFVAYRVRGVLRSLKIAHKLSPAFTPTDKSFVERVIGTIQHRFMALQPGFVGHSVADRKAIESRRAFAERLGETDKDAFCVELDQNELQRRVSAWAADDYAHQPHLGLDRETPHYRAVTWRGVPRIVEDERALDLLLAELPSGEGFRTVTNKGLRVENATFWGPDLEPGQRVRVRLDPADMGRLYVYTAEDDAFVCVAECPERVGISRAAVAAKAKADQAERKSKARAEVRRAGRSLRPLGEIAEQMAREALPPVIQLPIRGTPHETPALAAAAAAAGSERIAPPSPEAKPIVTPAPVIAMPERRETAEERSAREKRQRFARFKSIGADIAVGRPVTESDRRWHGLYARDAECRALIAAEELVAAGLVAAG